jgi:hypothetical protein
VTNGVPRQVSFCTKENIEVKKMVGKRNSEKFGIGIGFIWCCNKEDGREKKL